MYFVSVCVSLSLFVVSVCFVYALFQQAALLGYPTHADFVTQVRNMVYYNTLFRGFQVVIFRWSFCGLFVAADGGLCCQCGEVFE